jgi:CarD family transcriptional regulator
MKTEKEKTAKAKPAEKPAAKKTPDAKSDVAAKTAKKPAADKTKPEAKAPSKTEPKPPSKKTQEEKNKASAKTPKTPPAAEPNPAKPKKSAMFKVNQKVVYPSQGVGKIVEILDKQFNSETLSYYKIYLEVTDMIIMVPVDKVEELGVRAIVKPAEAQQALDTIGEDFEPVTTDWKLRYQMNLDLLKKGTVADIATIVRCLYHRSKVKELPVLERKLYDSAKKLLEDEISSALNLPAKEVEAAIHAKLEPAGVVHVTKHHAAEDEFLDEEFPEDTEPEKEDDLDFDDEDDIESGDEE